MSNRATIDAGAVFLSYADTPQSTFKSVVCEIDSNANLQRDEISEKTKCGTLKTGGQQNNNFSGNVTLVTDAASDEASNDELLALYASGDLKYWTWTNLAGTIFVGGYGRLINYNPSAPAEGFVRASFTISINGDIDTVLPS